MNFNNLSSVQLDVLREIGNIGAGNAATSMSKLINERVDMKVPSVKIVTFDEIMDIIGGPEQLIVALFFKVYGEAPGSVYFILTIEEAESLVSQITNQTGFKLMTDNQPDELSISVLKEVGNIMTGSYLSALSDFININMQSSIPYLSADMAGAILTAGLIELSQVSDYAIVIDTEISNEQVKNGLNGHFFFLPELETIPKFFSALGINGYA
jgi:chemotaxis protein CheC